MKLDELSTGEIVHFHTPDWRDTVPEWKVVAVSGENVELIAYPRQSDNFRRFANIDQLELAYGEDDL